jgi:hypothetical protein
MILRICLSLSCLLLMACTVALPFIYFSFVPHAKGLEAIPDLGLGSAVTQYENGESCVWCMVVYCVQYSVLCSV